MRVVLDTNVLASAILGGTSGRILDLWRAGKFDLVLTVEVLQEYLDGLVNTHDLYVGRPPRMKIPLDPPLQKGEAGGNGEPKRSPPFRKGGPGGFHI